MNKEFSVLELLKFAISIEEAGVKFYLDLATLDQSDESRAFMLKLADDEKQHVAVFQKIYDEVATEDNLYKYLTDSDVSAVFADYAKYTAFNREGMLNQSINGAIKAGILTEKITIDYYTAKFMGTDFKYR
jgi:rubrerythrin